MSASIHPTATEHLPIFITAPGQTDVLMVIVAAILLLSVMGFGLLFLRIHTLPERIAHRGHKLQFEIVAVLGLLALFTHIHLFWVAGLLLALVDFPDFGGALNRIAGGVETMAGIKPADAEAPPSEMPAQPGAMEPVAAKPEPVDQTRREDGARPGPKRPELVPAATGR